MEAIIIDGKKVADEFRARLAERVEKLAQRGVIPGLTAVLVGDDPASASYVRSKKKAAAEIGINSSVVELPAGTPQSELDSIIDGLNADDRVHGYIVQLPLPKQLNVEKTIQRILPVKDVDCFHPENVGLMTLGRPRFLPATPGGIIELLRAYNIQTSGAEVVILGRSDIVGRPLSIMLAQKAVMGNATVTVCHTRTRDWVRHTRNADILISAVGRANTVTAEMVKPGATVIDVGMNRIDDPSAKKGYRLVGDVDFAGVSQVAGAITPVPGGVGLMTVAMLLANTVTAAELRGQ
jgi:methylenetetrahydrofolate dehydrogenase (NADP+)/methenyltetrahydrofolate cyclohydrolase